MQNGGLKIELHEVCSGYVACQAHLRPKCCYRKTVGPVRERNEGRVTSVDRHRAGPALSEAAGPDNTRRKWLVNAPSAQRIVLTSDRCGTLELEWSTRGSAVSLLYSPPHA